MTLTVLALTDLRESFENDTEILGSILDMFLMEVPQDYLLLKQNIDSGAYIAAGMQAHKVKSSYRTLGIDDMASLLQEIEDRAKNEEDMEAIPVLLDAFSKNYDQVNAQVLHTRENL